MEKQEVRKITDFREAWERYKFAWERAQELADSLVELDTRYMYAPGISYDREPGEGGDYDKSLAYVVKKQEINSEIDAYMRVHDHWKSILERMIAESDLKNSAKSIARRYYIDLMSVRQISKHAGYRHQHVYRLLHDCDAELLSMPIPKDVQK